MKKSLLLFVSYVLAAVSVFAQQPAKPQPTFTSWVENKEVYLYNVEAGLFLVGGNEWSNNACLVAGGSNDLHITYSMLMHGYGSIAGTPWIIVASDENRGPSSDDYTYSFQRSTDSKLFLAVAGDNRAWVDGGPERGEKDYAGWTVVKKNADNTFQLGYIRKVERKDGEGNVIKEDDKVVYDFVAEKGVYGVYKFDNDTLTTYINENKAYSTWALVDAEEYARVLPEMQLYYSYTILQNIVNDVKALGYTKDVTSYEELLTKAGATLEEFNTAIPELKRSYDFGKVIKDAQDKDPNRSWAKFLTIYENKASTAKEIENSTKLISAIVELKKAIDEGKDLDAAHSYATAEDIYNSDESTQTQIEDETKRVKAFISLKQAINEATEKGEDVSAYVPVYNKADATAEELAEAEAAVKNIIEIHDITAATAEATVENPVDLTNHIVNPSFDKEGDFTGWSTGFGANGRKSTNAEVYGSKFDVYQDIKNLPGGVYMLVCNGYLRLNNSVAQDYAAWSSGQISQTKMYLQSETKGQYFTPVKFISAGGSKERLYTEQEDDELSTDAIDEEGNTYKLWTPNMMISADYYFHKSGPDGGASDRYRNVAYGPLAAGDVLRIGVMNDKAEGASWSIFDDFQLFFLGNGADAYKAWANSVPNNYNIKFDGKDYYGQPDKDAYDDILSAIEASDDPDEISTQILNLNQAAENIVTSKTNYAEYADLLNTAYAWLEENPGDNESRDILDTYLAAESPEDVEEYGFPNGPAQYIIPDFLNGGTVGILSAEKIAEETAYLKGIYEEAVKNTLTNGKDLTDVLKNADFSLSTSEQDWKGWTKQVANGGNVRVAQSCAEAWNNSSFDIYQEVEGLPEGLYEISVQGFYRYWRGKYADYVAQEVSYVQPGGSPVFVYMNNMTTPFVNVYAEPKEKAFYGSGMEVVDDNNCFPNDMTTAAKAFNDGMYTQKAYGLVKEGEKMRIGVKGNSSQQGDSWVIFDNFKLTYRAQDATAAGEVLKMKAEELKNLIDNSDMTTAAKNAANQAYNKYKGIQDPSLNYQTLAEVNEAFVAAQENITSVAAYKTAETTYKEKSEEFKNGSDEQVLTGKITAMDQEIKDDAYLALEAEALTDLTTRIEELTKEIQAAIDVIDAFKVADKAYNDAATELEAADQDGENAIWSEINAMDKDPKKKAYKTLTSEELKDLTERVEKLTEKIQVVLDLPAAKDMLEELATATDEEPVNVTKYLVNPDFETGNLDGWTYYKGSDTQAAQNSNGTYTINDERVGSRIFNTWNGSAPEEGFWVAQTIKVLPAGTYKLTAILASDKDNVITLSANNESADFKMTGDKGTAFDAELIFKHAVEAAAESPLRKAQSYANLEIKASSKTWFKADNFELWYYGEGSKLTPTEIEVVDVEPAPVKNGKYYQNGQLIIIKNGQKYNTMGVLIP